MASIESYILGKKFAIACADGQEDHVRALLDYVAKRIADVQANTTAGNAQYHLLLAALMITDDLFASRADLEETETEGMAAAATKKLSQEIGMLANTLEKINNSIA